MNGLVEKSDMMAYELFQEKKFDLAYNQCEISIKLDPINKNIRFNTAKCAYYANYYEKAIEHINVALLFDPECVECKRELALYLPWVGKVDESLKILQSLPQDHRTKFNMGWYYLREGNLIEGMRHLEFGRMINCWGSNNAFPIPKWHGEDLKNKKIIMIMEGGFGDEVIFSRFAKNLKELGAEVSIGCSTELQTVFERLEFVNEVISYSKEMNYDFWVPAMAISSIMKLDNIDDKPYLKVDNTFLEKWKNKIISDKLKIGIRWQGGKLYEHDQRRTLPINDLVNSLRDCGKLFSLQKDGDESCPDEVVDLEDELETWEDTIAAISLMDIVVTSCTSITHIAGALGIPTYVIVPIVPYFTWAKLGNKTEWYESITVIRQTNPYSWKEPINMVSKYLTPSKY